MGKVFRAITFLLTFAFCALVPAYIIYTSEQFRDDFVNYKGKYVVRVTNAATGGGGTGFFVQAPSGVTYILTNLHVCKAAAGETSTVLIDGSYFGTIIAKYSDHDLCLISNPKQSSGFAVADKTYNGENIYILGHPLLEPLSLVKGQISGSMIVTLLAGFDIPCKGPGYTEIDISDSLFGAITGYRTACLREYEAYAATANTLPGNSGSPVLNKWGRVVGVAFAGREGSGRGYLVPLSFIKDFLRDK